MSEIEYQSRGRTQITIINGCGKIVHQRVTGLNRIRVLGHFSPVSYPTCGDLYPAALSQARGWLEAFANQSVQVTYDDQGRVAVVTTFDATGVSLISTKTLFRDANGLLERVEIAEAVSGKKITRTLNRDAQNRVTSITRSFTRPA